MKSLLSISFLTLIMTNLAAAETMFLTIAHEIEQTGSIVCSVFTSEETFLRKPLKTIRVEVSSSDSTELKLQLEPQTNYALSCYLDSNDNSKLDTNILGIPLEPVATSNNATAAFGPPSYGDAVFTISTGAEKHQYISLDFAL